MTTGCAAAQCADVGCSGNDDVMQILRGLDDGAGALGVCEVSVGRFDRIIDLTQPGFSQLSPRRPQQLSGAAAINAN
jgi:hypothetical protein